MGVTCVFPIPLPDGKTSQQIIDGIKKKIEFLGGDKSISWSIDCETYQSVQSQDGTQKSLHILHTSERADLVFSILDNNTCVVADASFDSILSKLSAFYIPRKGGKMEVRGTSYKIFDFLIKIGTLTQASSFKEVVAEVHYTPCVDVNSCWSLLLEFIVQIFGKAVTPPPPPKSVVDTKLHVFSLCDTMLQYLEVIKTSKRM